MTGPFSVENLCHSFNFHLLLLSGYASYCLMFDHSNGLVQNCSKPSTRYPKYPQYVSIARACLLSVQKLRIVCFDWRTNVMMTSSNGNFPRYWPFAGGTTGHRWIPLTKANDAELWCFFDLCLKKRLIKQSRRRWFETPSRLLWRHCNMQSCVQYRLHWILLQKIRLHKMFY